MVPPSPAPPPPADDSWWGSVVRSLVCGTTPRVGKSPAGTPRLATDLEGDEYGGAYLELAGMRLRASELDSEIEGLKRTLTSASPFASPKAPPAPSSSEPALTERALAHADLLWSGLVSFGSPASRNNGELPPPPPAGDEHRHLPLVGTVLLTELLEHLPFLTSSQPCVDKHDHRKKADRE